MSTRPDWSRRAILAAAPALMALSRTDAVLTRDELFTVTDDGVRIPAREVSPPKPYGPPLILVHGARAPGIASFDLDNSALAADAERSARVTMVEIPGATHFVHLERPERGHDRSLAELTAFFQGLPE